MVYAIRHSSSAAAAPSGLDVLAGIWLLISPFVLAFSANSTAMANDVILGIIIAILALVRFFGPAENVGISWLNFLLGIWVLISPFVLRFDHLRAATTDNVVTGIVVIILSFWSAMVTSSGPRMNVPPSQPL